jgi:hypothetical protein
MAIALSVVLLVAGLLFASACVIVLMLDRLGRRRATREVESVETQLGYEVTLARLRRPSMSIRDYERLVVSARTVDTRRSQAVSGSVPVIDVPGRSNASGQPVDRTFTPRWKRRKNRFAPRPQVRDRSRSGVQR